MNRVLTDSVLVGRVVKPHGLRGDVVVEEMTDFDGRFEAGGDVLIVRPDGSCENETIERVGGYKGRLLVGFSGCSDRDDAELRRGCEIHVPRAAVPPAPDGEYYYFQLIDCACRDAEAGELGRVRAVIEDGGGLLLEVERTDRRLLIPFVKSYVLGVDVKHGEIELELPPGLLETCESTS